MELLDWSSVRVFHLLRPEADLMLWDLTCVRTGALAAIITHPFISSLLCAFLSCGHFQQLGPPRDANTPKSGTERYTYAAVFSFVKIMCLCSWTVTQRWVVSACAQTQWMVPLKGDVSKIWKTVKQIYIEIVRPYAFCDVQRPNGIAESGYKNVIYRDFGKILVE